MNDQQQIAFPELVIGLAGPVGIDAENLLSETSRALSDVGYRPEPILVTTEMKRFIIGAPEPEHEFHKAMATKMDQANDICRRYKDPSALMRVAIDAIKLRRQSVLPKDIVEEQAAPKTAFIIRQLKRPEEVNLLRRVYGRQFVLISAYGSRADRREVLKKNIAATLPVSTDDTEAYHLADKLIDRDENEGTEIFGQHLRDTFHLADVFVDGISLGKMRSGVERFFQAFFGRVDIAPTKLEYGMYAANSAALRSCDLSRQVGAAIFSEEGEIVSQGCNEVPKAKGGTYWDGEEPDNRDVKLGFDPNDANKQSILRDLIERLSEAKVLTPHLRANERSPQEIMLLLLGKSADKEEVSHGCLRSALINDLTEYGRVVHAEMSAICDAARLGRSTKGAVLFCTTFPCHNCTKHILAAGLDRVYFIEPYPKSKAKQLHENEIELDRRSSTRVSYLPFLGISPSRYRDVFSKKSRKKDGKAKVWYQDEPRPLVDISGPAYLDIESWEIIKLWDGADDGDLTKKDNRSDKL